MAFSLANKSEKEAQQCAYELCNVAFIPKRKNQHYHTAKCRKNAENHRLRGESLSDYVVRLKGRKCHGCGSDAPGKRLGFFWDDEERAIAEEARTPESIKHAAVACYRCFKIGNGLKLGQNKLMDHWDNLAERATESARAEETEMTNDVPQGLSVRYGDEIGGVDRTPGYIDRKNAKPPPQGEPGELFCRRCESLLGHVTDGKFSFAGSCSGTPIVENSSTPCSHCYRNTGKLVWTPLSDALEITGVRRMALGLAA